ncbi:MAG: flavodoxin domain-containing protein [Bifidobacteriaceae bacterium]|jgi:menaquinone-dependent protoporphyrinogen oxidase|nr:flavodoxin domain-containing protein [Bifidobacteriaceae bacterium]
MKALITVATKHGSTLEVGRAIAEVLRARGIDTTLLPPPAVATLEGFELVVLGSGVYSNKLLPTMTALGYRWGDQLSALPVHLFCSGPLDAAPAAVANLPHDARLLAKQLGSRSVKLFGGRLEPSELRATERALMRMSGARPGDYRDWAAVRDWAEQIAADAWGHCVERPRRRPFETPGPTATANWRSRLFAAGAASGRVAGSKTPPVAPQRNPT